MWSIPHSRQNGNENFINYIKDRKYFKPKANSKYEQSLKQVYENLEKKQGN